MSDTAPALPLEPGEPGDHVFPLRERLRLRDNFGLALRELRRSAVFAALEKGPWSLFMAVATHWQGNAEAWPGQEALARFTGWSSRAVRDQTAILEHDGVIRLRRERRADGSERIYYAPGPTTLHALATFVERFPRERPRSLRGVPSASAPTPVTSPDAVTPNEPPAPAAPPPPEPTSGEPGSLNSIQPSFSHSPEPAMPTRPYPNEQNRRFSPEDEDLARDALLERMARKYPTRLAPKGGLVDTSELAMVAACASALEGDREAKTRALRDSLTGAFAASKDGPPTVRFIWGKLEHFFDHAERGRALRLAADKKARAQARRTATPPPRDAPPARIERAQMTADLERLFGPGWARRAPARSSENRRPIEDSEPSPSPSVDFPDGAPVETGSPRVHSGAIGGSGGDRS